MADNPEYAAGEGPDGGQDIILDSIADGVFTVDEEWRVTSFNRAAERITGVERAEALGKPCCEVFRAEACETGCFLRRTMETGRPVVNRPVYIVRADGRRIPISVSTALLRDQEGRVRGGVETFRDLSLVEELRRELARRHTFADIISRSHKMQELFAILGPVAESDSTVLLEGESGTGKELVARAVHNLSRRREGPFVPVNCGALPDTLLESELFGYRAGAFTDARRDKPGRFARAEGGTIFLDEIGEISPALQVRLLRVLQDRTYEPLGASAAECADVRVVAATNRSLAEEMAAGRFREDLFYRVNVVRLVLPPLRERKEDVPLLLEHFVNRFNHLRGKDIAGFTEDALAALMNYNWPGNVRELENVVERAFILCSGGLIRCEHLPEQFQGSVAAEGSGLTLREIEARAIVAALERNGWRRMAAARELGIDKNTLRRKIQRLGIEPPR